jgi:hypothetical protein
MRKFLLFLTLLAPKIALSQVNDDFKDGNFTQNPVWQGDISAYHINSANQLKSTLSTVSQTVNLYTQNSLSLNVKWEFDINLGFDPSATNQARIYLISDQANFNGSINGYFVQIGESGSSDSYDLYRQNGNSITKIIDGPAKTRTKVDELNARVQVTRDANGFWELKTDMTGGSNFTTEGIVTDNTFTSTSFFGVKSIYSATRSALFTYDNVVISDLVPDVDPPILNSATTSDGLKITLIFNEVVDANEATKAANYFLNPGNISPTLVNVNGAIINLQFSNPLNTGNYTLNVKSIKDIKGNTAIDQSKNFYFKEPYTSKYHDLVINEIFADPNPQVDLPSVEFIEIWNRSTEDIALLGFKYSDPNSTATFGNDSIKANSYLILCAKTDTSEFKKYGKVLGISPWPSLNNASDQLLLVNQNGDIIDQINYTDNWYKNTTKKVGGYSLELIDPLSTCKTSQNYAASEDLSGGTPGKQNSVFLRTQNNVPLQFKSVILKDSLTLVLNFSSELDSLQATLISHYLVNNGIGNPKIALPIGPSFSSVEVYFNQALGRNQTYTVSAEGLTDCGKNTLSKQSQSVVFPGLILKNEVLINEVLFNPKPNGVDFVEIYNHSDKTFDFKDLKIASVNDKGEVANIKSIRNQTLLFEPKSYWVISSDTEIIKNQYYSNHPNNFIEITSMPSFNDISGSVVILNKDSSIIDQLNYDENIHFALLKDVDGVSIERSLFDLTTNAKGNFRSATASVGYATPADKNSQYLENKETTEEIVLVSQTISPDNDGFEDVLRILYHFTSANYVAKVSIYNSDGKLTKRLINNESIAAEGEWIWDGITDDGVKAKTGIYILYVEIFNINGETKKYKKTFVAASKLKE